MKEHNAKITDIINLKLLIDTMQSTEHSAKQL